MDRFTIIANLRDGSRRYLSGSRKFKEGDAANLLDRKRGRILYDSRDAADDHVQRLHGPAMSAGYWSNVQFFEAVRAK